MLIPYRIVRFYFGLLRLEEDVEGDGK